MSKFDKLLSSNVYCPQNFPHTLNVMYINEYEDYITITMTTKSLVTYMIKLAKTYKTPTKESDITAKMKFDKFHIRIVETGDLNFLLDLLDRIIKDENTLPTIHNHDGYEVMVRKINPGGWTPALRSITRRHTKPNPKHGYPDWDIICSNVLEDNDIVQSIVCHMNLMANGANTRYVHDHVYNRPYNPALRHLKPDRLELYSEINKVFIENKFDFPQKDLVDMFNRLTSLIFDNIPYYEEDYPF